MRSMVPSPPSEITRSSPSANASRRPRGARARSRRRRRRHAHLDAVLGEPAAAACSASSAALGAVAVRDEPDARTDALGALTCGTAASTARVERGVATTRRRRAGVRVHEELDVAVGAPQRRHHHADHDEPALGEPVARPRASTARCTSGSRTMPPLPTRARPASNCGFTSSTRSASGAVQRDERGRDRAQRDEREVGDHEVDRAAERRRARGRGRWCARAP